MKIVVIDGQGGRLGQLLFEMISMDADIVSNNELIAIGTNSIATSAMMKSGAHKGATGENPVLVACRDADIIIGPIGILAADSLLGEITPNMALAVGSSKALKLLLPVSHCNNQVVGVKKLSMNEMVSETVEQLKQVIISNH